MEQENQKLIEEIKTKIEDVYDQKVNPFTKDGRIERKASAIQDKIKTELDARHYAEDRYDRVHDREFYTQYGKDIPESLVKGEERAQQKAELQSLKKKIEEQLSDENSLETGKSR